MDIDFDKEVSQAHMQASGWELETFDHGNPFASHVIYVQDYRSRQLQLFTVSQEDFNRSQVVLSAEGYATVVCHLMRKLFQGNITACDSEKLGASLSGYIKATQTFQQWRMMASPHERLHAVLSIYPADKKGVEGIIRPVIQPSSKTVLSPDEVWACAEKVRQIDLKNHPEWFPKKLWKKRK